MSLYTQTTTFTDGMTPAGSQLNTEFAAIAAALAAIDSTNLAADSVPLSALATDGCYFALCFGPHDIDASGGAVLINTIQGGLPIPIASAKISAVYAYCTDHTDGTNPTVDVYSSALGATVLSAPITIAADNTAYAGTVSVTSARSLAEVLQIRCTVDNTKIMKDLNVVILLKVQLAAY